jgi:hypothetical protein
MQLFDKTYVFCFAVIFAGGMLNGCHRADEPARKAAGQATQFTNSAHIEIEAATDAATTMKAAEITLKALDKLIDAIIASSDLNATANVRKKFEVLKFKTAQQLHKFVMPGSDDCQNVLGILLQLDAKVKEFACSQRGADDSFNCSIIDEKAQTCQCARTSAGICPSNKGCTLSQDGTCQCRCDS